jgi:hypothetical protein
MDNKLSINVISIYRKRAKRYDWTSYIDIKHANLQSGGAVSKTLAVHTHNPGLTMTPQAEWQLGFPSLSMRADIRPTRAEVDHAVASIREWRLYLPPACVTAMIKDGWQWST